MLASLGVGNTLRHVLSTRGLKSCQTNLFQTITVPSRTAGLPCCPQCVLHTTRLVSPLKASLPTQARIQSKLGQITFKNLLTSRKWYAVVRSRLPFEVDTNVAKDTKIYTYSNDLFFRMLSIFGMVQFFFWGQLALFSYTSLDALKTEEGQRRINADTFWGKVIMLQSTYKTRIATLCMAIGTVVMFFTWIYPQRAIRQMTLLKGGQNLEVTTYSHFGRSKSFTVPVDHLSVQASRSSKGSQVSLKLKGRWFYYLMDKRDGKFHDTELFDFAVGLQRDLKRK